MPIRLRNELRDHAVVSPAPWLGRSVLIVAVLLFHGATELVPWSAVTETMDRIGYGSSETSARTLGAVTVICTLLQAVPPTSFVGAFLVAGYLGGMVGSYVQSDGAPLAGVLFGTCLGLMVWSGLPPRDIELRQLLPLRR